MIAMSVRSHLAGLGMPRLCGNPGLLAPWQVCIVMAVFLRLGPVTSA